MLTPPKARTRARKVRLAWVAFNYTIPFAISFKRSDCRSSLEAIVGDKQRVADGLRDGWLTINKVRIIPLPKRAQRRGR